MLSFNGMYLLCTTNFNMSYKNQPLLFAQGGWLEEKNRPNKIGKNVWYNEQMCEKLFDSLCIIFKNFLFKLFILSPNGMYILCTTYFVISYKNQPLLLPQGVSLEEKKYVKQDRQKSLAQWTNKWKVVWYFAYNFLKFANQSFCYHSMGCTSYVPRILLWVTKINPYCLHKVAGLKKKIGQTRQAKKFGTMNKYVDCCLILCIQFFKIC